MRKLIARASYGKETSENMVTIRCGERMWGIGEKGGRGKEQRLWGRSGPAEDFQGVSAKTLSITLVERDFQGGIVQMIGFGTTLKTSPSFQR